jgi:hypothetical protein
VTLSKHKVLAVLRLPQNPSELVVFARNVVTQMTGNPYFSQPVPALAKVSAAIAALQTATARAETRARGLVDVRIAKQAALESLLERLRVYVQGVADDMPESAPSIIEGAGMFVRKKTLPSKPPFTVRQGRVSGSAVLAAKAVAKNATYQWQMSADGGLTWNDLPPTLQAKTTVSGLTPGKDYLFRLRVVTRAGEGDWCDPVPFRPR